jgi:hypothetical protein
MMNDNFYNALKKISRDDERSKLIMHQIRDIMKSKKEKTIVQKLKENIKKPKTQPNGWE